MFIGNDTSVQKRSPPCIDADIAVGEITLRIMRSVKFISDIDPAEIISGIAYRITSKPPQGLVHQPVPAFGPGFAVVEELSECGIKVKSGSVKGRPIVTCSIESTIPLPAQEKCKV